jgi:hypothetical protein
VPALRDDIPANRRIQNLAGRLGGLHPSALLLLSALLDWPDDEAGDAHLPDVPLSFIKTVQSPSFKVQSQADDA